MIHKKLEYGSKAAAKMPINSIKIESGNTTNRKPIVMLRKNVIIKLIHVNINNFDTMSSIHLSLFLFVFEVLLF